MTDALSRFDQMSLSYTYENNGWSFTNYFDGSIRISELESRGTLRETVTIEELRDDVYMIAWVDEEMGPISQVVDLSMQRILAAVPWEGSVEIWPAKISAFVKGRI